MLAEWHDRPEHRVSYARPDANGCGPTTTSASTRWSCGRWWTAWCTAHDPLGGGLSGRAKLDGVQGTDTTSAGRRPHLVFLGHGAERTGPPILLGHLLAGLRATHAVNASVIVARSGPLESAYRRSGATVVSVAQGREPFEPLAAGLRRTGFGRWVPDVQDRRRRHIVGRVEAPDLVYINAATTPTAALLRALDPPAETPVVLHVHELDVGLRRSLAEADRMFLFDRADHVIAASGAVDRLLVGGHGVDPDRITTCAEFVDADGVNPLERGDARRRLTLPDDALVIGSVGLPDWRKDPEHLLRAAAHLRQAGVDPWVVWVGGHPNSVDGTHLSDEAARLGLTDRFRHVAHTDRPDQWLGAFDVFALPAREDALPLAALEAGAAGLPLVCFRTGGVADLCDLGAGIAVGYPDTEAFAAALFALAVDGGGSAGRAAGATAAALVRRDHDLSDGVARIRRVIDAVLAGSARR